MRGNNGISRRRVLRMAGAGAGFAGGMRAASAQGEAHRKLDPGLDKIIETSEPIKDIAEVSAARSDRPKGRWWKEGGYLLFTDIHNNRRMKYTPGAASPSISNRRTGRTGSPATSRAGSCPASTTPGA
jgi:hypothetical protein